MSAGTDSHVVPEAPAAGGEPKLTVRILRRCNFCCPRCSTFSGTGQSGQIALSDIEAIAGTLAAEDFRGVVNVSGGEPTLHPDLESILRCLSAGLPLARIILFTNGSWIGSPGWESALRRMLAHPNVRVRLSLDKEHILGESRATGRDIEDTRRAAFGRAREFLTFCHAVSAEPGVQYDVAFKGSEQEAHAYLAELGRVPLYLITLREDPTNRPRTAGFFAVDIDREGTPSVYQTLGHFAVREPLGGLPALAEALAFNRANLGGPD